MFLCTLATLVDGVQRLLVAVAVHLAVAPHGLHREGQRCLVVLHLVVEPSEVVRPAVDEDELVG